MEALAAEFEKLGYRVIRSYSQHNVVVLSEFTIYTGTHSGKIVEVGVTGRDFPFAAPAGIHVRPALAPNGSNNISASPLGGDWQYWSRRLDDWASNRNARHIVSYIHKVFADA